MDVGIQFARRQVNVEDQQRVFSFGQQATIALLQRLLQRLRLYPATIHKERDILASALRQDAIADVAAYGVVRTIADIYGMEHLVQREMIELSQGHGQIA